MKAELSSGVKSEVKSEGGIEGADCFIEKIDYTKRVPDFRLVPQNVIKDELQRNGIRTLIKKAELMTLIIYIWQYRKAGELPF